MLQQGGARRVEAAVRASIVSLEVVNYDFAEPVEGSLEQEGDFLFDLCLTPRPIGARASYRQWRYNRFERLGDVFLVPAGHMVRACSERGRQLSVICRLHGGAFIEGFKPGLDWSDRQLEEALNIRNPGIRGLLMRLGQETQYPGLASEVMIELLAGQLAIELARFHSDIREARVVGGLSPWRLKRIDQRLHEDAEPPTLQELAELCGLSTRQLTRGFRASHGTSIGDHITALRAERAKRMLAGSHSIKEIAYASGFGSPSSFSYAFRRATGETPRQFQRKIGRVVEPDNDDGLIRTV